MTEAELFAEVKRRINPNLTKNWEDILFACRKNSMNYALAMLSRATKRKEIALVEWDIRNACKVRGIDADEYLSRYPHTLKGLHQAAIDKAEVLLQWYENYCVYPKDKKD